MRTHNLAILTVLALLVASASAAAQDATPTSDAPPEGCKTAEDGTVHCSEPPPCDAATCQPPDDCKRDEAGNVHCPPPPGEEPNQPPPTTDSKNACRDNGDGSFTCTPPPECMDGSRDCPIPDDCVKNADGTHTCRPPHRDEPASPPTDGPRDACRDNGDGTMTCTPPPECMDGSRDCPVPEQCRKNSDGTLTCKRPDHDGSQQPPPTGEPRDACRPNGDGTMTCTQPPECMDGTRDCRVPEQCRKNADGTLTCKPPEGGDGAPHHGEMRDGAKPDCRENADGSFTCQAPPECRDRAASECRIPEGCARSGDGSFTCRPPEGREGDHRGAEENCKPVAGEEGMFICTPPAECDGKLYANEDCTPPEFCRDNQDGTFTCKMPREMQREFEGRAGADARMREQRASGDCARPPPGGSSDDPFASDDDPFGDDGFPGDEGPAHEQDAPRDHEAPACEPGEDSRAKMDEARSAIRAMTRDTMENFLIDMQHERASYEDALRALRETYRTDVRALSDEYFQAKSALRDDYSACLREARASEDLTRESWNAARDACKSTALSGLVHLKENILMRKLDLKDTAAFEFETLKEGTKSRVDELVQSTCWNLSDRIYGILEAKGVYDVELTAFVGRGDLGMCARVVFDEGFESSGSVWDGSGSGGHPDPDKPPTQASPDPDKQPTQASPDPDKQPTHASPDPDKQPSASTTSNDGSSDPATASTTGADSEPAPTATPESPAATS